MGYTADRLSHRNRAEWLAAISLVSTAAVLAFALIHLAVDDAFITFRHAFNLAHQRGFVYNSGQAVLTTTAPFYGILLAAPAWLGVDVPTVGNLLSGIAIGVGGLCLFAIGRRHNRMLLGWLAGMLYVLNPLLWLSLGMETALQLALILVAFATDDSNRPGYAGLALGAAFVTRYDAALPAAILFFHRLWRNRRAAWRMAATGLVIAAPVLFFLSIAFGSPLPATLAAKQAQAQLGVTGFYNGTTYLQGLGILAQGWLEQTWLYVFPVLACAGGLFLFVLYERWIAPYLLWAFLHIVAYMILGDAPYFWYYAPLLPGLVWLSALGVERIATRPPITRARSLVTATVCLAALAPFAYSMTAIWQAQTGPLNDPAAATSKVLPEAKVNVYRRAGEWLAANTPSDATVGATEVGIIGFYSRRQMIDFLGLLQPQVARAVARGNLEWTLFNYQPDYVVLTAIHPIYNFDPRRDDWFLAAYRPIQRFDDAQFWSSPVVVYRRDTAYVHPTEEHPSASNVSTVNAYFDKTIQLVAVEPSAQTVGPHETFAVRLWWRARSVVTQDYAYSAQLLGQEDLIVAQRDAQPGMGMRPTSTWPPGEAVPDLALIGLPTTACVPDLAQLNIVLYEPRTGQRVPVTDADGHVLGDSLRVGRFMIGSNAGDASAMNHVDLSFARALTLTSYRISPRALQPGETLELSANWQAGQDWQDGLSVFVHLVTERGEKIVAQADAPVVLSGTDRRRLRLPPDASPGVYRLLVGVYRQTSGERLSWLDDAGQPLGDSVSLCPVRVR